MEDRYLAVSQNKQLYFDLEAHTDIQSEVEEKRAYVECILY